MRCFVVTVVFLSIAGLTSAAMPETPASSCSLASLASMAIASALAVAGILMLPVPQGQDLFHRPDYEDTE